MVLALKQVRGDLLGIGAGPSEPEEKGCQFNLKASKNPAGRKTPGKNSLTHGLGLGGV